MLYVKTTIDLLYFLSKIDLDTYLECNDIEKFDCIEKILLDDFGDLTTVRMRQILSVLNGFLKFFDNIKY